MPIEDELCQNIEKEIMSEKKESDARLEIELEEFNQEGDVLECSDDQIFIKKDCK